MLVVLIVELLYHELLIKMYPSLKENNLLSMGSFLNFLPFFKAWIRSFHQNCRVLTNVLGGSTSRFEVEARARAYRGDQLRDLLPPNLQVGSCGRNLQATGCDLGGKLEPSVVTWYSAPPSRPTPSEAKGGGPYEIKSKIVSNCASTKHKVSRSFEMKWN